jgi:type III restriction enzyme
MRHISIISVLRWVHNMQFKLKDYQEDAVAKTLRRLADAYDDYHNKNRLVAFALSAITGAGKTVMASAVFEALFEGSQEFEFDADPTAVVLWVTDDPNLNEQTRYRIMEASDRLGPSRLTVIEDKFDAECLDAGKVYFLNRQKLTGKTFITRGDKRTYTLWETIGNTINDRNRTLYLVLDEAHRGMRPANVSKDADESERSTTVLRLINGHNGAPSLPIVWGISATVERFNDAMEGAKDRFTLPNVVVDNTRVQESGLLKDTITLDLPDEAGAFETVLAREAAKACREASKLWEDYAVREKLAEPVRPLLVVQVANKPSAAAIKKLLDTIYDEWKELPLDAVANVFGEHSDEKYGSHEVPYVAPQDVEDATHIRVLLAKDAISTGWDCPRAETLISLRPAKDRTHITQLLGRLVRAPLARRIESDERLNAVTCFLPHFDLATAKHVADVMTGVAQERESLDSPRARRVLIEPVTFLWNKSIPAEVKDCFVNLPSKSSPRAPAKPTRRLLNLAAEIAIDGLRPNPTQEAYDRLFAVLDGQLAQHGVEVGAKVAAILTAEIKRITANRLVGESSEASIQLASDKGTVDDAFKTATRAFGVAIANGYAKRLALKAAHDDALDISAAKARVAALAMIPAVVDQVEATADQIIAEWFSALHAAVKALSDERRSTYDEIKQQAKEPQRVDVVVPASRMEMTYELDGEEKKLLPSRELHVLSDEEGYFPVGKLRDWEIAVLDAELGRDLTVAWYRNPSHPTKDSVQVPWQKSGGGSHSMQPDFVFFVRNAEGEIAPAIVDPHGHHLSDALDKLGALTDFAEEFGEHFMRIEAVSKNEKGDLGTGLKGKLVMLDLLDSKVRTIVRASESAVAAYRRAAIEYR